VREFYEAIKAGKPRLLKEKGYGGYDNVASRVYKDAKLLAFDLRVRDDVALSIVKKKQIINSETELHWKDGSMDHESKRDKLESVAEEYLATVGISSRPRIVLGTTRGMSSAGKLVFVPPPPTIYVNHIRKGVDIDFGPALKTLLHETRHYYQRITMDKFINADVNDLSFEEVIRAQEWIAANKKRKTSDRFENRKDVEDYFNNDREADAETNARELVDAIERALESN
jgi:hypothetical protein